MLYVSLLALPRSAARWRFLEPYQLHQLVWKAFPGLKRGEREQRFLYRHDAHDDLHSVLVQSAVAPDWGFLADEHPQSIRPVRRFDASAIEPGACFRFILRANPVVNRGGYGELDAKGDEKRRRIAVGSDRARVARMLGVPVEQVPTRDEQLVAWLRRHGEEGGFHVSECEPGPNRDLVIRQSCACDRTFTGVDFEGVLQIEDAGRFARTLQHGVGRGKGFGFGLLSLKRMPAG